MLRIVALGRVELRSLSFLDNPFHLELGNSNANGTLSGGFLSLAIVWVAWATVSIAASIFGSGCGHNNATRNDRGDADDGNDRSARLIGQQDVDEPQTGNDDDSTSCSPRRPHSTECWVALVTPTTVLMFPWMMISTYSVSSGGDVGRVARKFGY